MLHQVFLENNPNVIIEVGRMWGAGLNLNGQEGTEIDTTIASFIGGSTDPNDFTASINWGDGNTTSGTIEGDGQGNFTVRGTHIYSLYSSQNGYPVAVTVADGADPSINVVLSATATIANVTPVVNAGEDATISYNSTFTGPGAFTDPGSDIWAGTVDYGDGSGVQSLTLNANKTFDLSHQYTGSGPYTVTVTITDSGGATGTDTLIVNVTNPAPALSGVSLTSSINENGTATLSGTLSDANSDPLSLTVTWGDGTENTYNFQAGTTSFSVTHVYLDDNPTNTSSDSYQAVLQLSDGTSSTPANASITVNNVAPTLSNVTEGSSADEGAEVTLTGTITDPSPNDSFTLVVAWGTGDTTTVQLQAGATSFSLTHAYADNSPASNPFTISVTLTDDDTGETTDQTTITVNNVAPSFSLGEAVTIAEGMTFSRNGSVTDPGGVDTVSGTVDYGDGGGVQALTMIGRDFTLGHAYDDNGTYTITVVTTDDDGGTHTETLQITVTNVAPSATFSNNGLVSAGNPATFSFTSIFDPSNADTLAGFLFAFDFNNDGYFTDDGEVFAVSDNYWSHSWEEAGTYMIHGRITDKDGGFLDLFSELTVQ